MSKKFTSRLKLAAWLIAVAMIVELFTMISGHPLSFIVFAGVAAPLLGLGILLYFWSLLSLPTQVDGKEAEVDSRS